MRRRDVRALRQQSEEWRWSAPLVLDGEEDEDEDEVFEPEQEDDL
jgi:hypothetical protein